ncbi:MAG: hypothetical protein IH845_05050 [Nanoarchaeota archaeon]|nr:hypothetical protein [Nanoarchaeota archaeon]
MEMRQLARLVIAVLVLIILVGGVITLFKEGGGNLLADIRNVFRFGDA